MYCSARVENNHYALMESAIAAVQTDAIPSQTTGGRGKLELIAYQFMIYIGDLC